MFFKKKTDRAKSIERETSMVPGTIFLWPNGGKITAIDSVIIALPKALFQGDGKMESIVEANDGMNIAMPPDSENIYLYAQPGMSVTLKKPSQSYLVANDRTPRRIRITETTIS